eukprot:m.11287 g.11287  ORF g.11287 m.11287 type:complete len:386 (-) comp3814_c0_seq1:1675-2832(-)
MPPKTTIVEVNYPMGTGVFEITSKTTGHMLYEEVMAKLDLEGSMFFNLQYVDNKDYEAFVKADKKILSHDLKKAEKGANHQFTLLAQYFPELINEEMPDPSAQELFWNQIRDNIVTDACYAPPELCVLFAAMSLQVSHGDLVDDLQSLSGLDHNLPDRVKMQHSLTSDEWDQRIKNAWNSLKGKSKSEVINEYLNIAQDLEQYGVTYFLIQNKKGTKLWLGVHNLGMDIYSFKNKVTPRLGFPWTEIKNISFSDKKFTIKMVDGKTPDFKFYSPRFKLNKRILALCVENHKMYVERRKLQFSGEGMVEDRKAVEEKIKRTREQLLAIRHDLDTCRDEEKHTEEDKAYEEQKKSGLDKFTTMKRAQSGDARKRIEEFEEMGDEAEC